jgi:hypothetical protein
LDDFPSYHKTNEKSSRTMSWASEENENQLY